MKKPRAVRSLLYAGDLLAVDLGSHAVKIMHVKAKIRSLTVLGSAQRQVWQELAEAKTDEDRIGVYAGALRVLLADHVFKVRNASISVSGSGVVVRFLTLPAGYVPGSDKDLPAEARALIPFEAADTQVSALISEAAGAEKPPRLEMMLAAAQKKTVQGAMETVRKAGLRPAVIANDIVALAGAHEFFSGRKPEAVVLVSAGAASTSVSVVENGSIRAARVFNIAGNTFTRAIKRELSVELDEAERLKLAYGLLSPSGGRPAEEDELAARVSRALKPPVVDLAAEIRRTIDAFLSRRPGDDAALQKIVLAGGSAKLKGLAQSLEAATGLHVETFNPMVNVAGKDGTLGIAPLDAALAVPCGLGLSNTLLRRSASSRINLVPKRTRRAAIIRDITPGFWKTVIGPAVLVGALSVYGVYAVRQSREEAALEQKLEDAAKKEKALEAKFAAKKKKASAPPKAEANPFAYLGRLKVSGVFGAGRDAMVMLEGPGGSYTARGGKLFDSSEAAVRGVASEIRDNALTLAAGGKLYKIDVPR